MHSPLQAARPEKNYAILGSNPRRAMKLPQAKRKRKVSARVQSFPRLPRSVPSERIASTSRKLFPEWTAASQVGHSR